MSRLGGKVVSLPSKRSNSWVVDDWESENTPNKKPSKQSSSSESSSSSFSSRSSASSSSSRSSASSSSSRSSASSSSSGESKLSNIHNPAISSPAKLSDIHNPAVSSSSSGSSSRSSASSSSSRSSASSSSSGEAKLSNIHNSGISSPGGLDPYSSQLSQYSGANSIAKIKIKFIRSKDRTSTIANGAANGVPNVKRLLSTGILQGANVTYRKQENKLPGIISGLGYLCGCTRCNFSVLVNAMQFEQHAGCKTKNQNCHVFLDNGKSLYQLVQELKNTPSESLNDHIQALISGEMVEPATHSTPAPSYLVFKQKNCLPKKSFKMDSCVSKSVTGEKTSTGRKKRDNDLHQLVFMPNGVPEGAELSYYASGKRLLDGYKQGDGIVCSCCDQKIRPSVFEAHAGCGTKRQPYRHIFTSDGVSLHDLSISLQCRQRIDPSFQ